MQTTRQRRKERLKRALVQERWLKSAASRAPLKSAVERRCDALLKGAGGGVSQRFNMGVL
jgi:hypothetical protein